jgi:hypothetical protein
MPTDSEKAKKIVATRNNWVGAHGALPKNVAAAVEEGIRLGRKEGLELAAAAIQEQLRKAVAQQLGAEYCEAVGDDRDDEMEEGFRRNMDNPKA